LYYEFSEIFQPHTKEKIGKKIEKAVRLVNNSSLREAESILLEIEKEELPGKEKAYLLLGMLYKSKGSYQTAADYLKKAADNYPLLSDYALKLLADVYIVLDQYDSVVETAKQINNSLLLKDAKKFEITALLALKKEEEAVDALSRYIKEYPEDWDYKFNLASLLKDRRDTDKAVSIFKDIFINAVPLSDEARNELKVLEADIFTKKETLERAGNLYTQHDYKKAEAAYKRVLNDADSQEKGRIIYKIAMCQFRQKKYDQSAISFGLLGSPKSMYWRARSYYRIDDRQGFERTKIEFEKKYPGSSYLALVLLMEADELRRQGKVRTADGIYKKVLARFPKKAEDALWGLGWMNYSSGDYQKALGYFSKLNSYVKSREYYKYLYWEARTKKRLSENCILREAVQGSSKSNDVCGKGKNNFYSRLPSDESYYGYLIKLNSLAHELADKVEISQPVRPEGEAYLRIEALSLLGMKDDAVVEIVDSLKRVKKREEFLYLGYMAVQLNEYKEVIAFAEPRREKEFLPYSYPLGYWDVVKEAAESERLDAHLVTALIREESRFDPMVVSWAGAIGLMQLIPSTAYRLKDDARVHLNDKSELQDPEKNILLGVHYLSQLVSEFEDVPLAIAAYNAGERVLRNWISRFNKNNIIEFIENIPYKETRRYVKKVLKSYWQYRVINGLTINAPPSICNGKC
jgi:soluble lytic murein transglycosylase